MAARKFVEVHTELLGKENYSEVISPQIWNMVVHTGVVCCRSASVSFKSIWLHSRAGTNRGRGERIYP
eukprot:599530-Pyramimonas_sp.AAC.1